MNQTTSLALAAAAGLIAVGLIRTFPNLTGGISNALLAVWLVELYFMTKVGAPSVRGTPRAIFHEVRRSGYRVSWQARILTAALFMLLGYVIWFQVHG
jgi:hypothetical protein